MRLVLDDGKTVGAVARDLDLTETALRDWVKRAQADRRYYERARTHLALAKDTPIPRLVFGDGVVVAIPEIGGLHHRYERRAA